MILFLLQTCAGHDAGSETAVHELFGAATNEAALFVDSSNAFNCINRQAALHKLCLSFSTMPQNTYHSPVGQGKFPLLRAKHKVTPLPWTCMHWLWFLWFVVCMMKFLMFLRSGLLSLLVLSRHSNLVATLIILWSSLWLLYKTVKTILIVKPEYLTKAQILFADTNIRQLLVFNGILVLRICRGVCSWQDTVLDFWSLPWLRL